MKTLVELFDKCQIENVIACLEYKPEKIIFLGFKEVMTKKRINDLKRFFELKNIDVEIETEIVGRYDYKSITDKLNAIIDNNQDCYFDLTGGKELVLAAMGDVSASRNVPMFQFNVRTGNLIRVKNCDTLPEEMKKVMSINEIVTLNGGSVIYNQPDDFQWQMTSDFKKDVGIIWDICRKNCGLWNRQSNVFENFEKYGKLSADFVVTADIEHLKRGKHDVLLNARIVNELISNGLIDDYVYEDGKVSFRYKNSQVHQCITKAGNILELYVYMAANRVVEEYPDFYDDIDIGIYVDWDGVIHDGTTKERDTINEIDVMLMRDLVPVFVSCKNGEVHKEALYELDIIAKRFGGEYSKKIMVTTYISNDAESRRYIKQRAKDMNIDIIDGVHLMTCTEFTETLKKRAK